ncbi:TVP38/TMEM64 family protein [Patulibacter defluvii]|uniref:TVP38/TMEM64 family protein n=1 Tax=Patulibacter defluvii TaxID=3095358 RepID=UPI002A75E392|nr:VTT domain-containing protein [Patulibacter sp. DM4]
MSGRPVPRWLVPLGTVVGTLLLLGGLLAIPALRDALGTALRGDTTQLRTDLRALGVGGALILFLLVQVHAVVFYPAEIVLAVAGFVYGWALGLGLMVVAWAVSAVLCWLLGRSIGRPVVRAAFGERRVDGLERLLARQGTFPLLAARLIPVVPYALAGYVAGALRVPLPRYAWTSVVGYLPLQAAVVLLGHRLDDLSPTDPLLWAAFAPLLILLVATRPLLRRIERRHARAQQPAER